jgi:voltage-gated potassium channel
MLPESSTGRRWFEISGQLLVLYSVVVFYMESELTEPGSPRAAEGFWLWNERLLLVLFCCEYLFRWSAASNRKRYPFTLLAAIDLLAILPTLVGLTVGFRSLKLVRILPLLWMFKLHRYNDALQRVLHGFRRVKHELSVVGFVAIIVVLASSIAMHEFEREAQPDKFGHLGDSVWWSFVTLTTVGYGDLYPVTIGGRIVAVGTMLVGIGVLGTFLSLVGSSFLTTMREHEGTLDESHDPLAPPESVPLAPPWTQRKAG